MKMLDIVNGPQNASRIILGCMRMPALDVDSAAKIISCASELGVNFFDHATCYGDGEAETRFGDAFSLTGLKREDVIIQSKCGLHFDTQEFNWSKIWSFKISCCNRMDTKTSSQDAGNRRNYESRALEGYL